MPKDTGYYHNHSPQDSRRYRESEFRNQPTRRPYHPDLVERWAIERERERKREETGYYQPGHQDSQPNRYEPTYGDPRGRPMSQHQSDYRPYERRREERTGYEQPRYRYSQSNRSESDSYRYQEGQGQPDTQTSDRLREREIRVEAWSLVNIETGIEKIDRDIRSIKGTIEEFEIHANKILGNQKKYVDSGKIVNTSIDALDKGKKVPYCLKEVNDAYIECQAGYRDVMQYNHLRGIIGRKKRFLDNFISKNLKLINEVKVSTNDEKELVKGKRDRNTILKQSLNVLWQKFNLCVSDSLRTRDEVNSKVFLPGNREVWLKSWIREEYRKNWLREAEIRKTEETADAILERLNLQDL